MTGDSLDLARSTRTRIARRHAWHVAGWGGYEDAVMHAYATREVTTVGAADPSSSPVGGKTARAMGVLTSGALYPGCDALEIRYVCAPSSDGPARVRMFLTAKSYRPGETGRRLAQESVDAAAAALPADWTHERVVVDWSAQPDAGAPVFELRRHEEVTFPQWEYVPADFFYTIADDPGDGSGWASFWASLTNVREPVTVSLLFKQTELAFDEQESLASITSDLRIFAEARRDYDLTGREVLYPADSSAAAALASWTARIDQLHRPLLARLAVRGEPGAALAVASALAGAIALTERTDAHPRAMFVDAPSTDGERRAAEESFELLEAYPWGGHPLWADPLAPLSLRRMPYLFGLRESSGLLVLPVPDAQGAPGFPRARALTGRRSNAFAAAQGPSIRLGRALHLGVPAGPLDLTLDTLTRHALVVGSPGSGKTTTVQSLLVRLWTEHRIPWLVFESTKREYRALLDLPGMEQMRVVVLGRDDIAPIRLNPLEPPRGVRREVHEAAVLAALRASLPIPPPIPQLLAESLDLAYLRAGWDEDTVAEDASGPPGLRDLLRAFDEVFERKGYVGEARNLAAATRVRLRSIVSGAKGRVFDSIGSSDFEDLLSVPAVVELQEVADPDDKAAYTGFLVDRVRGAASRRSGVAGSLVHVTVIEEAHRLLPRSTVSSAEHGGDPRSAAVDALSNALAELRSAGEGIVVCSQSPSRLAPAAMANTATKVVHRLESGEDREILLTDLGDDADRATAARLGQGEAMVRWPGADEVEVVRVDPPTGVDSARQVEDDDVRRRMQAHTDAVRAILPYPFCRKDVCTRGCDPAVRGIGRRVAHDISDAATAAFTASGGSVSSLPTIVDLSRRRVAELAGPGRGAEQQRESTFCGVAHLWLEPPGLAAVPASQLGHHLVSTL